MVILHVFAWKPPKFGFHRQANLDLCFWVLILQRKRTRDLFTFGVQVNNFQEGEGISHSHQEDVVYANSGILFGLEKGGNRATCNSMNGPGRQYAR